MEDLVRSCLELTAVVSLKRKLSLRESARCRRVRPSAGPFSNLNPFSLLLCSSVLYLLIVASVIGDWFPSVHTLKNIHTRVQPEAIRSCSPWSFHTAHKTSRPQRGRPVSVSIFVPVMWVRSAFGFAARTRTSERTYFTLTNTEQCTHCIPISKRHTVNKSCI